MAKKIQAKVEPGEIKVRCSGSANVDLDELIEFQGAFKGVSEADLAKLKLQLTKQGIAAASTVWKRTIKGKEVLSLLDGTQRKTALLSLRTEGWTIPKIPVNFTQCKDEAEARRTVMALASTYGHVEGGELLDFVGMAGLDVPHLADQFSFPDFDLKGFVEIAPEETGKEVSFKVKPRKRIVCPKCGESFNPKETKN